MRCVVLLALLGSVAHADDDLDVQGRDAPEIRGDAMIWEDAPLYLEPWDGGTKVLLSTFGRARRDETGRAAPVKIVGATRDFVEVELVQAESCTWRRVTSDSRVAAMRVFVKRADLAPVLVKPYAMTYSDGTSVKLAAGVPVTPMPSGEYVASARGDMLRLPIPHASVGFVYARGKVVEPALPSGELWAIERAPTVKLGDNEFEARANWIGVKPAKHGETVNMKWSTRCIELVVNVPAKSLRKVTKPRTDPSGYITTATVLPHAIPKGTPLAITSGREVGVAATEIYVQPPTSDKACFDAQFSLARLEDRHGMLANRAFRLCAPADVVEGPAVSPGSVADPLAAPTDVNAPPRDAHRTAKGVSYKRLDAGKRGTRKPKPDDTVVVHYTGWTIDGNMFDSSHKHGQPSRFALRSLIEGWIDALQIMSIGDKYRIWIPEELAYKGAPGKPQGMLVFDIELLGID